MVALLVKLRWRQLSRQLGRNPWYIVTLVLSTLGALGILGGFALLLAALRVTAPDAAIPGLVIAGSVITLGWWLGSLLVSGDDSLAPERFSLLPVTGRGLLPGLVVAGATSIGAIATVLALLLMLVGWSVHLLAALAALILLPVALATCVLGARVVSGALAKWLAGRRARDLVVTVGVLLLAFSGVLINVVTTSLVGAGDIGGALEAIARVLAWTPVGAAFGVPAAVAAGNWGVALFQLVIAVATPAVLWLIAERMLSARLVAPIVASGGGRVRSRGVLDRILPSTPAGAIAARTLRYRRRDPRHLVNTVMVIAFPILIFGILVMNSFSTGFDLVARPTILIPAVNAVMVMSIVQMELAYDHDAVALHATSGVSGAADRGGRLLAVGAIAIPVTVIFSALACAFTGAWELLPASLGASFGTILVGAAGAAFVGVFLPGRAPAPGANPFGRGSSGGTQALLSSLIILPVTFVLGAPAFGFAVAALWYPALGWVSLALALVIGGAAVWGAVVWGGRALDRRWPQVYAAVTSET